MSTESWKENYGSESDKSIINNRKLVAIERATDLERRAERARLESTPEYKINDCIKKWPYYLAVAYIAIVVVCFVLGLNYKHQGNNWAWLGTGIALACIPCAVILYGICAYATWICCGSSIK